MKISPNSVRCQHFHSISCPIFLVNLMENGMWLGDTIFLSTFSIFQAYTQLKSNEYYTEPSPQLLDALDKSHKFSVRNQPNHNFHSDPAQFQLICPSTSLNVGKWRLALCFHRTWIEDLFSNLDQYLAFGDITLLKESGWETDKKVLFSKY